MLPPVYNSWSSHNKALPTGISFSVYMTSYSTDVLCCYAFLNTSSFCYIRQSSASCASYSVLVEVKMVVYLLSWKRFEKILLYTDLALDKADGDDSDMESYLRVA